MKKSGSLLALALIALVASLPAIAAAETGARAIPDHVALTWAGDPKTTQTITWRCSADVKAGTVEYAIGTSLGAETKKVSAKAAPYKSDLGVDSLFTATLTGLKKDTVYAYRVGDGSSWSETATFRTAGSGDFEFLVFGDSQSGSADKPVYDPWRATLRAAFDANKDARFFVNMGDLVEIGYMQAHWNAWFDAAKGVIDRIPEMPVQGNHETYVDGGETVMDKPVSWLGQLPTPQNGPAGLKGQVYGYSVGNVDFFVLDSQEDEESPKYGDILAAQAAWLDKALAASTADFKIAFFHKTPYYNKAARANEAVKATFCPILEKHHVDIVFNGHDHGLSRTYPVKGDSFFSDPKDGTVYYVTGRSGNKYYNDLTNKFWNAFFYDPQDQGVYLAVNVAGKKLTVTARKADGTVLDVYAIDKAGSGSTITPAPARFNATRTAAFGNFLVGSAMNPSLARKGASGAWFCDLNALAAYLGATVTMGDGTAEIALGKLVARIPAEGLALESGKPTLVSVDALKSLGISATYYPDLNVLSLVR